MKNILKQSIFTSRWKYSFGRGFQASSVRFILAFNSEHSQLRETTRKIVENDINPYVDKWTELEQFDGRTVFKKLGNAGLLGLTKPTKYNGLNLDYTFTVAMYEEIGKTINCGGITSAISVQTEMTLPALCKFGSDELKKKFLSPTVTGDYIACVGISEATGGSDVAAIKTKAVLKGDDLIINGEKMWITNGCQADWICLLANTNQDKPHKNKSLICVPMDSKKITKTRIKKIGQHCSDTAIINFDNVHVPVTNVIGELNEGFTYQMIQFQEERLVIGAICVGVFQRILEKTIEYCKERSTFGKNLIDNQYIHFHLAELQTEVELFRAFYYETVERFNQGENVTYQVSMIKLKAGRLARKLVDDCLQYFGGLGYSRELSIGKTFTDLRVLSIAGGADEIMLAIICKFMGILPSKSSK